jgi:hypothetical protein
VELGVIAGTTTNPSYLDYGISTSFGFLVPLVKLEFELTRKDNSEGTDFPTSFISGIKFRPSFGRLMPYAIVGVGMEFRRFNLFDNKTYNDFTFIGGGIYYKIMVFFSIRADIRFLNFKGYNRTRLTAGLFFSF